MIFLVYALKFAASWILPPGLFVILMLALVVKLFRVDRKLSILVFVFTTVFYLLCTSFVAEKLMGWLEDEYSPPAQIETSGADVIVMLGGGAIGQVPDVDGVGVLCASPASRLLAAVRLQKILNVPILVSGGQVYSDSGAEAEIAARILKSLGVPEDKILTETRSVNKCFPHAPRNAQLPTESFHARAVPDRLHRREKSDFPLHENAPAGGSSLAQRDGHAGSFAHDCHGNFQDLRSD